MSFNVYEYMCVIYTNKYKHMKLWIVLILTSGKEGRKDGEDLAVSVYYFLKKIRSKIKKR